MHQSFVDYLADRNLIPDNVGQQIRNTRCYIREPIGMIAAGHGLLRPDQIDLVLDRQRDSQQRFGDIAVELGCLKREQVDLLVAIQDFRAVAAAAESLALTGVLSWDDAVHYLGVFLAHDDETAKLLAQK